MKNLGKANTYIKLSNSLVNVDADRQKVNFDVSAHSWKLYEKSPVMSPILVENATDESTGFAACFPAKRKYYVNNLMDSSSTSTTTPTSSTTSTATTLTTPIKWRPVDPSSSSIKGVALGLKSQYDSTYGRQPVGTYASAPKEYIGPKWADAAVEEIPPPNDAQYLASWDSFLTGVGAPPAPPPAGTAVLPEGSQTNYINQTVVRDGLFWVVESDSFLQENMPFWVNIRRMSSPPSKKHPTWFIISFGEESDTDSYDLYLGSDSKPFLADYNDQGVGAWGGKMFDEDLSRVFNTEKNIEIGIMTIGGRLIISVNKVNLFYTRVTKGSGDNAGKIREAKIAPGKVRIYGTNVSACINVCPMTFAPSSIMCIPLPSFVVSTSSGTSTLAVDYKGVDMYGAAVGTVAELPTDPSSEKVYGVDCELFRSIGGGGDCAPTGFGFHKKGKVYFWKGGAITASSNPNSDFWFLKMKSADAFGIPYAGAPFFFRLKGLKVFTGGMGSSGSPFYDVISVSQTSDAPDFTHSAQSATVTLYNKNGAYDNLKTYEAGIEIYMGWEGSITKTFTGIVTSVNFSEEPGKETVTLSCEDYMYLLKNTPIINSPFYDGMLKFNAVKDLVERAGIMNIINEWPDYSDSEYALPAGHAFTKPAVRYGNTQMLFDCCVDLLKRDVSFFFFDADGRLHIRHVDGGLLSVGASEAVVKYFVVDPDEGDVTNIILDQQSVDVDFKNTANVISILTAERDTRNPIIYSTSSPAPIVPYRKVRLMDQPALGGLEDAIVQAEREGERCFFSVKKIAFKTVGDNTVKPLSFINVSGQEFRVTSISRKYSADSNDFINEYNCEWLGGG